MQRGNELIFRLSMLLQSFHKFYVFFLLRVILDLKEYDEGMKKSISCEILCWVVLFFMMMLCSKMMMMTTTMMKEDGDEPMSQR